MHDASMTMRRSVLLPLLCLVAVSQAQDDTDPVWSFYAASTVPGSSFGAGAYLWIPGGIPKIRAVMVGIHNGLPFEILQSPAVRATCRRHGIAQVLLTPNGCEIGPVMLANLSFDVTDPVRTAVYDEFLGSLARLSGHPELVTAPIVPLAHSAYMSFAFDAAVRDPERSLASLPIKAGIPDVYAFYGPGGKALHPNPSLSLRNVPLLLITSGSQETVGWSAYPHDFGYSPLGPYRQDEDNNTGSTYQPRDELFGANWEMMCGHFDLLPRDYQFIADWLDAVAAARLPDSISDPMRNLTLKDGFLMHPWVPMTGELPADFPLPKPYLQFNGTRSQAVWYPTMQLAETQFQRLYQSARQMIEFFTLRDPQGQPYNLSGHWFPGVVYINSAQDLLFGDGRLELLTYHFTEPPLVCFDNTGCSNILFPNQTKLPLSNISLRFDENGAPLELLGQEEFMDERGVQETRFIVRLKPHRLNPDPSGYTMYFPRIYHEGDDHFVASGRTVNIIIVGGMVRSGGVAQQITFDAIADVPATISRVDLKANSSAGLPVGFFVHSGPGVIQGSSFIPVDVPAALSVPVNVTIGAYQAGNYTGRSDTILAAQTVYQSFRMLP